MVPNSISNSLVIPISSGLQTLESTGSGSAAQAAIAAIFKAGTFTDGKGTWFSAFQIISIVAS